MKRFRIAVVAFAALVGSLLAAEPEFRGKPRPGGKFELLDGDRVAFIGDTLIERAQSNDSLETALTIRWPDRHVIFRNLGWSGDDVTGIARSGFGTAEDGFKQLKQQVSDFKPTVIFLGYGANASFGGARALPQFRDGYKRLLDMLAESKAVTILLSPIPHEDVGRPLPKPETFNENRRLYSEAIGGLARDAGLKFVDVFHYLKSDPAVEKERLTENGIHLTDEGYRQLARVIEGQLDWPAATDAFSLRIDLDSKASDQSSAGAVVADLKSEDSGVSFTATLGTLPPPRESAAVRLAVHGLKEGTYLLKVDGAERASGTAEEWSKGKSLENCPDKGQVEELRRTILAKNQLFFYRWRPQNETYLFGFRKHEQGQNAKEIPMFDPLIEAKEKEIARLRKPSPHKYELIRK